MKSLLTIKNILIAIPLLFLAVALHYALPQVDVVRAVGVEIKRLDATESNAAEASTRDVYYIQMETQDGDPRVYRNEDNFIYLKFDSADLQARVQSLSANKELVALRHYGWRVQLFSMFPNAVKAWPVEEGYRHIPVFNTLVLLVLGGIFFMIYRRVRATVLRSREALEARRTARADSEAAALREKEAAAEARRAEERKNQDDVDAFLNDDNK